MSIKLHIVVWDWDCVTRNDCIGDVEVTVGELLSAAGTAPLELRYKGRSGGSLKILRATLS